MEEKEEVIQLVKVHDLEAKTFINKVKEEFQRPANIKDIKSFIDSRYRNRKIGYHLEWISKVLTGVSTSFAFASSYLDSKYGSLISGSIGVLAVTSQNLSSYFLSRSDDNNEKLNRILETLGIKGMPDVIDEDENV